MRSRSWEVMVDFDVKTKKPSTHQDEWIGSSKARLHVGETR